MGRLVDMFGEGQEGLLFVMDHTALCGLLVVAGGQLRSGLRWSAARLVTCVSATNHVQEKTS